MIWFLIIVLLVAALFFWVLYPKLNIIIEYRGGKLKILFRSILFRYTLDDERIRGFSGKGKKKTTGEETEKKESEPEQTAESFFGKVEKFKRQFYEIKEVIDVVFEYAGGRIEFSDIYVFARYGTGDAAHTGMIYGAVWGLVGNVYAFLCRYFNIEFPSIELVPMFNEKTFQLDAEGIIKMRLVHIITAALRGFKVYNKHRKEKERMKDGRTASDSGLDVHSDAEHQRND